MTASKSNATSAANRLSAILKHLPFVGGNSEPTTVTDAVILELQATFPSDQLSLDKATLDRHGTTFGTTIAPRPPIVVVHAESTADVVKVVHLATKHRVVIIPVGGRTSLEGQFLPPTCCNPPARDRYLASPVAPPSFETVRPTIHLSLSRMDKVLKVYPIDAQAIVQPGVGWQSLNEHLEETGVPLFFPIDPGPKAEFGGSIAVAGSGTNAVGYGTMRAEWIQNMEVVLMNGEVIRTRGTGRSRKSSTGWDVGRLFIGSEGTLGIITEVTVRLAPVVPLKVALTSFPTVAEAVSAVVAIVQAGLSPTSLELLDDVSIKGTNLAQLLPEQLPEEPTVMMRFSNPNSQAIDAALDQVRTIVRENGGRELRVAKNEKENQKLWGARKAQYWSQQLLIGDGCRVLITDICVPISRLAEFVSRSDEQVRASGLLAPIVAHIGDGNVHRAILYTAGSEQAAGKLAGELSRLAISLEGTCAGEHGIGTTKRKYLPQELGRGTLSVMRRIKRELDPLGLLNPGKVVFEAEEEEAYWATHTE